MTPIRTVKQPNTNPDEHGIGSATYALAPVGRYGEYRPSMSCLCGFTTGKVNGEWVGANSTWEETGAELDAHLAEVTDGRP